jgi:hypothetical protein
MTSRWVVAWGAALLVALGVLAWSETTPPRLVARGSDSELAAVVLEQRFDESIRGPSAEPSSTPALVVGVSLAAGVLGLALGDGDGSRVIVAAATTVTAVCAGALATLLELGGPGAALAAAASGITFVATVRSSSPARPILGPLVTVLFYLGIGVAALPAVREAAGAAAVGTVCGWAATRVVPRSAHEAGPIRRRLPRAAALLGGAGLLLLAVGAVLRPLPLEAADVAAPRGFQVVVKNPAGWRGPGFVPLYRFAHALQKEQGIERVESIATLVPEATPEQAQSFFLSPLGAEPSRELVAGPELTRLKLRTDLAPGSLRARALVGRVRARAQQMRGDVTVLVGGRTATLVDVRAELRRSYWGLALALVPVWLALRLLGGHSAWAATIASGVAGLAGAACLGLVSMLPNTSPAQRIDPAVALTVAAAISGAAAALTSPGADQAISRYRNPNRRPGSKNE